jgi:hypothetical protein
LFASARIALCALTFGLPAAATEPLSYNRDILPILSNNCFACHGPDAPARKAGLRLDHEEAAKQVLPSGATAIVPGDATASALLQRINTTDPGDLMPPPESAKSLTIAQKEILARWIAEGAAWEEHWAFIAPVAVEPPAVTNTAWPRNSIDNFVLAHLESEGIAPAPEADRPTLIRRVTLDLTGLPPTPEEVAAFINDPASDAYEKVVERLLASPRHGEHRARQWLDIARYADTNGYAGDVGRTMWRYRDWVIDAFNANMPFDQFTIEQLAGDLLPEPTVEQRIATGFNRNHPIMMEGGAIFEEFRVQNVVDRVDTTATAWLGLTMKCAQCHDHKYDPISQKEFFEFYAYFNNVSEEESKLFGTEIDGNSLPRIKAPLPAQQAEAARLEAALQSVREAKLRDDATLDAAQQQWEIAEREATVGRWIPFVANAITEDTAAPGLVITGDTTLRDITALRLDSVPGTDLKLAEVELHIAPIAGEAPEARVGFAESSATRDGVKLAHDGNMETVFAVTGPESTSVIFVPAAPFSFAEGTRIRVVLRGTDLAAARDRIQLRLSSDPAYLPASLGGWLVNGPYIAATGDEALATAHVDPNQIDLGAKYDDGRAKWIAFPGGLADGAAHNLSGKTCATYFHRNIGAPSPRTMDVSLDNRNAVRLWVNGRLVLDKEAQRGEVGAHPAPVTIELKAGDNSILVKTVDYYDFNAHTFFFARHGEPIGPMSLEVERALLREPAARTDAEKTALRTFYRSRHWDQWPALHTQELDRVWDLAQLDKQVPTTMVMEDLAEPRPAHILVRGLYDQPGEPVSPGVPAALHDWPEDLPRNRLGLAKWLMDPANPLTARIAVNRDWQRFFGEGLSRTTDDFGAQGEWPSHPELLDWLARDFIASGWDMKALQRRIVTSATYRQVSRVRPELADRDPENRLLARGPRYRLDAEQIRDNALAASGLLVEALGGPSVLPYQPPGLWRDVAYGGGGLRYTAQEFVQDHGDKLYRRSLYTFWKRAAAPPGMLVFDAPNREVCTARRSRSNTPLQALALMNDTQYVEAARAMAERIMKEAGPDATARIDYACTLLLARPARAAEKAALLAQFEAQLADYRNVPEAGKELLSTGESDYDTTLDPAEFAAWTLVANALMNTDAAVTQF